MTGAEDLSNGDDGILRTVQLNDWYRRFPPYAVGGSIYAVPSPHRLEAASLLTANRCRVHVDVIVGPQGHRGVSWRELAAVRAGLPDARIDLHLIIEDLQPSAEEAVAIDMARQLQLEAVTLSGDQIRQHRGPLERLREKGVKVFEEIRPGQVALQGEPEADGALIMLIPPGTIQAADPSQLDKIGDIALHRLVAVDGGVTRELAKQCHVRGADYVVSGRDLLTINSASHHPETGQEKPIT